MKLPSDPAQLTKLKDRVNLGLSIGAVTLVLAFVGLAVYWIVTST